MPALTPVTLPVEPAVAIKVLLLLQAPPPTSLNGVLANWQMVNTPDMAAGSAVTVTTLVARHPPIE